MKGEITTLITDKEKETLDKTSSHDNNNNIDNQSDPGININHRPFTYRDEQNITPEISLIREAVVNADVHNPLSQTNGETDPVLNPDLHTPLPSNKKDHFQQDQQQIINRLEAEISAWKSHLKCNVSTMNDTIDFLSDVIENKVNVVSDQYKNFEMLQGNIKFLQMELKAKNEIINNLLDTQSAIFESLSLAKQQNSQAVSLAKQQTKVQNKPELHLNYTELAQPTRESLQQQQQNKQRVHTAYLKKKKSWTFYDFQRRKI